MKVNAFPGRWRVVERWIERERKDDTPSSSKSPVNHGVWRTSYIFIVVSTALSTWFPEDALFSEHGRLGSITASPTVGLIGLL